MTQTQKHLLKLFSEIDKICKENDIDYYIAGGSTIGAVRHEGFIPWDDDFDIMMTRKNFLKFVDYCKDNLPDDRILECQELNRNYHNMFARYTDKSSCTLHQSQMYHDDTAGFVIDVFQLDPLPDDQESYKKYTEDILLYSDLLNDYAIYSFRYGVNAKRYFKYKLKMLFLGKDRVLSELEKRMFSYDEETAKFYAMRWGGLTFLFKKEMFEKKRFVPLCDINAQTMYRTSDYLVQHYGDNWFLLPPNQEQQAHDAIFSTEIEQQKVRNVLKKGLNLKFSYFLFTIRKLAYFSLMKTQKTIKNNRRFLKARAIEFDINKDLNEKNQLILSLDKQKDYNKLQEIFSEYFSMQLSRTFIGREDFGGIEVFLNPLLFKIDDEIFEIAIKTLINKNGMASALRLMDVYEQHGYTLSENLKYYKELLLLFRSLVSRKDVGEDISDKHRIKEVIDTFPCAEMFINFALELYQDDEQQFDKILEYAIEHAPKEDLVVKAQLDKKELDYQTLSSYISLYDSSSNGLLRLSIKKILENKSAIILDILNKSQNMKEATYLSYKMARITPNTKEYIEFYVKNGIEIFTSFKEYSDFYISLNKYYVDVFECKEQLKHFCSLVTKVHQTIFNNEYLPECLPFLTEDDNLDQTNQRLNKIQKLKLNSDKDSKIDWAELFSLFCYKKLGLMQKAHQNCSHLIQSLGTNPYFDTLFTLNLLEDISAILDIDSLLQDNELLIEKCRNVFEKKVTQNNLKQVRQFYKNSIVDTISKFFDTPKHAKELLERFNIINQELLDLNLSIYFKKSKINKAFDSWTYNILLCLCESVEHEQLPLNHATHSNSTTGKNQDDTNEGEQFDDIRSRATVLLSEIDEICKANDITYALYNCSIDALKEKRLPTEKIKVIVGATDFDKLVCLLQNQNRSDRSLESLKTNPSYQSFGAKYFDLNSTRINLLDPHSKIDAGICVEILPVCPRVNDKKLQKRLLETEVLTYTFKDIITSPKYLLAYLSSKVKSLFTNKQKRADRLYSDLIAKYSTAKSSKYFVKEHGLSRLVMDENPLKELITFKVDGVEATVPQKINDYLKAIKRLPKTNVYKNENKSINRVVSQNCKREEFISLYKKEIDDFAHAAKKQLNLQRIVTILNRKRKKNWKKANIIAHKFIQKEELKLAEKDCKIKYQDYLDNLKNSGANALYLIKYL